MLYELHWNRLSLLPYLYAFTPKWHGAFYDEFAHFMLQDQNWTVLIDWHHKKRTTLTLFNVIVYFNISHVLSLARHVRSPCVKYHTGRHWKTSANISCHPCRAICLLWGKKYYLKEISHCRVVYTYIYIHTYMCLLSLYTYNSWWLPVNYSRDVIFHPIPCRRWEFEMSWFEKAFRITGTYGLHVLPANERHKTWTNVKNHPCTIKHLQNIIPNIYLFSARVTSISHQVRVR